MRRQTSSGKGMNENDGVVSATARTKATTTPSIGFTKKVGFIVALLLCLTGHSDAFFQQNHLMKYKLNFVSKHGLKAATLEAITVVEAQSLKKPSLIPRERKHSLKAKRNQRWEAKYQQLKDFKERYGHVDVPQYPTQSIPDVDRELSIFCRNVRSQYRNLQETDRRQLSFLTQDRINKLEDLGFVWNSQEARWNLRYNELVEYYKEHNHSNVPTRWEENPELSSWVSAQRLRYKGKNNRKPLTETQLKLLKSISFRWTPKDELWWNNYEELKQFKLNEGHFGVTCPKMKRWKYQLRRLCREYVIAVSIVGSTDDVHVSGLNSERIDALKDINFCWMPSPSSRDDSLSSPPEDIFEGYQ